MWTCTSSACTQALPNVVATRKASSWDRIYSRTNRSSFQFFVQTCYLTHLEIRLGQKSAPSISCLDPSSLSPSLQLRLDLSIFTRYTVHIVYSPQVGVSVVAFTPYATNLGYFTLSMSHPWTSQTWERCVFALNPLPLCRNNLSTSTRTIKPPCA